MNARTKANKLVTTLASTRKGKAVPKPGKALKAPAMKSSATDEDFKPSTKGKRLPKASEVALPDTSSDVVAQVTEALSEEAVAKQAKQDERDALIAERGVLLDSIVKAKGRLASIRVALRGVKGSKSASSKADADPKWWEVSCPKCKAKSGEKCVNPGGTVWTTATVHRQRKEKATAAAAK